METVEAARFVQAVHDGEAEAALCGALGEEGGGRCVVEGDEGFVDAGGDGGEVAARAVVLAEVFRDEISEGGAGFMAREDADVFSLLLEDADLAAERGVHAGARAIDEGEGGFRGVVAVFHAGGFGDGMRADERGVEAETMACGTGATAAAVVAVAKGLASSPVRLRTRGGVELGVQFSGDGASAEHVLLRGPAHLVYRGELTAEALVE